MTEIDASCLTALVHPRRVSMNGLRLMLTWLLRFNLAYLAHEVVFCASHPSSCRRGTGEKNQTWLARCRLQKLNSISWPGGQGGQGFWACLYIAYATKSKSKQLHPINGTRSFGKSFSVLSSFPVLLTIQAWPSVALNIGSSPVIGSAATEIPTQAFGTCSLQVMPSNVRIKKSKRGSEAKNMKLCSYVILLATFI